MVYAPILCMVVQIIIVRLVTIISSPTSMMAHVFTPVAPIQMHTITIPLQVVTMVSVPILSMVARIIIRRHVIMINIQTSMMDLVFIRVAMIRKRITTIHLQGVIMAFALTSFMAVQIIIPLPVIIMLTQILMMVLVFIRGALILQPLTIIR